MSFFLVYSPSIQLGGNPIEVCPYEFDELEEVQLYLEKKLGYDKLGISLMINPIPYREPMAKWLSNYTIYIVNLKHHHFTINWYVLEQKESNSNALVKKEDTIYGLELIKTNIEYPPNERDNDLSWKNMNLEAKDNEIIHNQYLPKNVDGMPTIEYKIKNAEFELEHKTEPILGLELQTNDDLGTIDGVIDDIECHFVKNHTSYFDSYDMFVVDTNSDRYFIKRYNKNKQDTMKLIIGNEYLFQFFETSGLVGIPDRIYLDNNDCVYRIFKNVCPEKVDDIVDSKYNADPISADFIIINSILHYFHIGIVEKQNLLKVDGKYYIFDIVSLLPLEYVNYKNQCDSLHPLEREIIEKLSEISLEDIKTKVCQSFRNTTIDVNMMMVVINDCEKMIKETIEYLLGK